MSRSPRGERPRARAANHVRNDAMAAMPEPRKAAQAIGPPRNAADRNTAGIARKQPEAGLPSVLADRRLHLEVDRIGVGLAADEERRERVAGQQEIRLDVRRIADVAGEEVVEPLGDWPLMSVPNQLMTVTTNATMLQSPSQNRWGMESSSRKKTVSRAGEGRPSRRDGSGAPSTGSPRCEPIALLSHLALRPSRARRFASSGASAR